MSQLSVYALRVLILGDAPEATEAIATVLRQEPGISVSTSKAAAGTGVRAVTQSEPDVAVVIADSLMDTDPLLTIEELTTTGLQTVVVVLTGHQHPRSRDFILAGARDCISPPYERETLVSSLRRVHALETRRRERMDARGKATVRQHPCRIVAVHGAKGGTGSTTIAVNLAVALKKLTDERVALVDASLQLADVGVAMNLHGTATILDLVSNLHEMDVELLDRVLASHSSGVRVLLGVPDLEHSDAITSQHMRRILTILSASFDYIVVDTCATLDGVGLSVMDQAQKIVLVTTPELPALKNAGRFLALAKTLAYSADKILLLVNRAGSHDAITLSEIAKSLGVEPAATVPSAGGLFVKAANRGEDIIATRGAGKVTQGVYALATQISGRATGGNESSSEASQRWLFGRFRHKKEEQQRETVVSPGIVPLR